ncbi:MAG TPA: alpha/beta fold hydrolase, partial [Acidimicrobiales bacterium]|nr:alpha/beta fold hydrolase [Acidimicrobiales bacterium]
FASIEIPTLLIHGEADAIIPVAASHAIAAVMADATVVIIPGAGHVPTLTRPEAVVIEIDKWWQPRR